MSDPDSLDLSPLTTPLWVVPLQIFVSGAVLFVVSVGIISEVAEYDGGGSAIGYFVVSAFAAGVTTLLLIAVGLPLRNVPRARAVWHAHAWAMWVLALLGIGLVILSFSVGSAHTVHVPADEVLPAADLHQPDWIVLIAGWLMIGFGCTHLLWPFRSRRQ